MAASRCLLLAAALSGLAGGLALSAAPSMALADTPDTHLIAPQILDRSSELSLTPAIESARCVSDVPAQDIGSKVMDPGNLSLEPSPLVGHSADAPVYLDDAPAAEKPNIHGFIELPFKTAYVTPRGLVVENKGVVWQPVGGLVFPLGDFGPMEKVAFITGIWNSVNGSQGDPRVGAWNEMDIFESLSANIGDFSTTLTYGAWNFPNSTLAKPRTEHVSDLKVTYDDTKLALFGNSGITLHPYVDFFYAIAGSSNVVLGRQGSTYYAEIGVVPTYTYKGITNYPMTFTLPTYFSVGPENYWGAGSSGGTKAGNFGVVSCSADVSVPLSFIPGRYGDWHADAGLSYYYLANSNLLRAGDILTGNTNRSFFQGSVGIGVGF